MGDNVDEPSVELYLFDDIEDHFGRLIGFVGNYTEAGFVQFDLIDEEGASVEL